MSNFKWIEFYSEFATALLQYECDRSTLIGLINQCYYNLNAKVLTLCDIDPFTVFTLFNRTGIADADKIAILTQIRVWFGISATVPTGFYGIPQVSTKLFFEDEDKTEDIDNLWSLFRCAIMYADKQESKSDFIQAFNTVIKQKGVKWNITVGLSWIRPLTFIPLNTHNRKLLKENQSRFESDVDIEKVLRTHQLCGENYFLLMRKVEEIMPEYTAFPELSWDARASAEVGKYFNCATSDDCSTTDVITDDAITDVAKNTILYGPPGTGKTYHTVVYAVAIVENETLDSIQEEAKKAYPNVLERYKKYKAEGLIEFTTFHQSYGYEEFIEGIKPVMDNTGNGRSDIQYSIEDGLFKAFCNKPIVSTKKKNCVFIIDEINRGNISKIFGELITLIEPSKRMGQPEEIQLKLPYSQKLFGVPDNVYIIGTMNTADRSIATIDTALRRRFRFQEMMPNAEVLAGINIEDLSVSEMLVRMNKRISVLYDREHTIGHAYFIPLKNNPTVEQLAKIFENAIIPLLQEYFYEDYEKIRLVLGDNNKSDQNEQFIIAIENDYNELFGGTDIGFDDSVTYEINRVAFHNIEAYRSI